MPAFTVLAAGSSVKCDAVNLRDGLQQDVVDSYRGLCADAMSFHFVAMTPDDVEVAIQYLQRFKENLSHVPRSHPAARAADPHRADLASLVSAIVAGGAASVVSAASSAPGS